MNRLAEELSTRENTIVAEFSRGGEADAVAESVGVSEEQLESSILEILSKLHFGAMRCVLDEPAPLVVEPERELAAAV